MKNKRILIVEVNWLGDVLFSTAAIRALKTMYPESFIACLVHKRCKEILMDNPNINEIITLDEDGRHRGLFGKMRLISCLSRKKFDTVYLFHRSFTRTLICLLSGIRNRIGYVTSKRRLLLTESIISPAETMHRAGYYLYLIMRAVVNDKDMLRSDFFINDCDKDYIQDLLKKMEIAKNRKIVVMHPAGNWFPKRWPKEYFAQLADELVKKYDVNIVFSGAQRERPLIDDILKLMHKKAANLSGMMSLKQLGALFQESNLVISADSGPLHIAVAMDSPTVGLFGPTSPEITGPLTDRNIITLQKDVGCVTPCYNHDCPDSRCMEKISVQDVLDSIEGKKWLEKKK
ncbi:lipopolysaccharide heptosyltransferase II [Thermoproteota archaeon]